MYNGGLSGLFGMRVLDYQAFPYVCLCAEINLAATYA
jgi:hypothetical protein